MRIQRNYVVEIIRRVQIFSVPAKHRAFQRSRRTILGLRLKIRVDESDVRVVINDGELRAVRVRGQERRSVRGLRGDREVSLRGARVKQKFVTGTSESINKQVFAV